MVQDVTFGQKVLSLTILGLSLTIWVGIPGGRTTAMSAIPIIAISKHVPETPPNDPVIPGSIVRHRSVVPDPGFGRRG